LAFRTKAKKLNRLRRINKITAVKLLFTIKDEIPKGSTVDIFSRPEGGIGFRHFLLESGEENRSR
jgi:hypothetical protein